MIVMLDIIEHFTREELFPLMETVVRSLRPGGRLIASVPNAESPDGLRCVYADITHEIAFTPMSFEEMLFCHGPGTPPLHRHVTDNFDREHNNELKANIVFTRLDLEGPPVEKTEGWVEAVRLMRLIPARNGVIAENILRGGPIEFFGGPWRVDDNDFHGTQPGTYSHGVFTAHDPHDLLVRGNRTRAVGASGKTWRFLVMTGHAPTTSSSETSSSRSDRATTIQFLGTTSPRSF